MPNEEYKTICDTCGRKTWYETEQKCHCSYPKKDLDPRFTPFYERGERIEVEYEDGTKSRFYVGKSTGWKPVYLEIKKSNSSGGDVIYTDGIVKITPLNRYK
uniref:Uncharacterized protein n=1 Tax=viral metagenome TaxID=1070528 RepID=A0A6H2A5D1_9ZZZZ